MNKIAIKDQETDKDVAFVLNDKVFAVALGTPEICTLRAGSIYSFDDPQQPIGHLRGDYVTGLNTPEMPVRFKRLLVKAGVSGLGED